MTEEEKKRMRIAVARDIITYIDDYIMMSKNTYIDPYPNLITQRELKALLSEDSRENAILLRKNCKVCALGACLLSLVKIDNKYDFKGENAFCSSSIKARLLEIFEGNQILEIELAFEEIDKWLTMYPNDKKRMVAICENILRNNGKFLYFKS